MTSFAMSSELSAGFLSCILQDERANGSGEGSYAMFVCPHTWGTPSLPGGQLIKISICREFACL
jgi:hypothetical protein